LPSKQTSRPPSGTALRLGIAGLGTVGGGVLKLLEKHGERIAAAVGRPISVAGISAKSKKKDRGVDLSGFAWYDDPVKLASAPDIDVLVELMGGEGGAAKASVEAALGAGKHVVTANKALLAHHGTKLAALAEKQGVALNFEAAAAGGIPIIKALREALVGNEIARVYGILNGTSNFILTMMQEEGWSYTDALKEAQKLGYAEADPTFDVGGYDAAHKLALLTSLAFGTQVSIKDAFVEGIETIDAADIEAAIDLGYRIKLLGVAKRTARGIEQRVHPAFVPAHSAIAEVNGVTNCVAVNGDFVRDILLVGPGAGAGPTASAVVSDIVDIARGLVLTPFVVPAAGLAPFKGASMAAHEGAYYVRLSVLDKPGAFASIAARMAEQGVSLESIVQRRPKAALPGIGAKGEPGAPVPVVMITHVTTETAIRKALAGMQSDGKIDKKPQMIRIEPL
jgi:homoserine dehydrogenase